MGEIILKNIKLYAYHGCLVEESIIGSQYRVDLKLKTSLRKSVESDKLKDTIDYVKINALVEKEMLKPSKLLENVGQRILDSLFKEFKGIKKATVKISKINPPINGDVEMVTIKLNKKKDVKM